MSPTSDLHRKVKSLELLAPARDVDTAIQAIIHGADAVYIGAPSHGARAKAANSISGIRRLVEFAAPFAAKVYVTVNTIIYDNELPDVERMIWELYNIGVDALIVQDMALLEINLPPIPLHASTQCDTRGPEKAKFLADAGFSQIVIARETDIATMRRICGAVDVPVEAFVHGALCVSYSGDCRASQVFTGRSANRGNCAQICRLPFDLVDGKGSAVGTRHYLSLRDLNRLADLAEMADAGVTSFKIEGRLKDVAYVKEVTLAYRNALDAIIAANPDRYRRSSRGVTKANFNPDLTKSFNRGFTDYFLHPAGVGPMASLASPKALGEEIGKVTRSYGNIVEASMHAPLANGDGISYVTPSGAAGGFRANKVDRSRIYMTEHRQLPAGTLLYRSLDRQREAMLAKTTAERLIPVDIAISRTDAATVALAATIDDIGQVCITADCNNQPANNDQREYRRSQLSKLGGTIFSLRGYSDSIPGQFIPASQLAEMKRRLAATIMSALLASRPMQLRQMHRSYPPLPDGYHVTYRDNIANRLAENFYRKCGASDIAKAIEVAPPHAGDAITLMETRYCIRRELGACLQQGGAKRLPEPLTLKAAGFSCRLKFDCANCRMRVEYTAN